MKASIKRICKENYSLYRFANFIIRQYYRLTGGITIRNKGKGSFTTDIIGRENEVDAEKRSEFFYMFFLSL